MVETAMTVGIKRSIWNGSLLSNCSLCFRCVNLASKSYSRSKICRRTDQVAQTTCFVLYHTCSVAVNQWLLAHSRYQSRQPALATLAEVLTFIPQRICLTAPSTLQSLSVTIQRFPNETNPKLTFFHSPSLEFQDTHQSHQEHVSHSALSLPYS